MGFMHSRRHTRLPTCYKNYLPSSAVPGFPLNPSLPPTALLHSVKFKTMLDGMGMFRGYPRYPRTIRCTNLVDAIDAPTLQVAESDSQLDDLYLAFSHPTAGLLMSWQYSGGMTKSADELDRLWTYIQDPKFNPWIDTIFSHDQERKK